MEFTEEQIQEEIEKEISKLHLELLLISKALQKMSDKQYARDAAIKILHTKSLVSKVKSN